jgi:hypothetical protein
VRLTVALLALGALLIVAGIALWSIPAGVIAAGLLCCVAGVAVLDLPGDDGGDD